MFHTDHKEDFNLLKDRLLTNNVIYLFGYGSLMWKVDFEYTRKLYGFVKNYKRHFWLLSDDHRGTPENLGRVVTLVKTENESDKVYGVAYEIHSDNMEKTFENLHFREKCGYSLKEIIFYPHENKKSKVFESNPKFITCVCYYANEDNSYYSPTNDLSLLSSQIHKSIGPSGTNKEYLFNLCNALRELIKQNSQNDSEEENELSKIFQYENHLFELENKVKSLEFY
ncbi:unnamed protein product [Brachionus calyciflorus]|uniref:glutathione-specific gamma-glutamylcyclotransferase n=1 Tax=Brachionus calyciflorus TaxID=104777 RepID=A0A813Q232_9BILA|nr:unnamed protein product [Brachionus calyciflorus]